MHRRECLGSLLSPKKWRRRGTEYFDIIFPFLSAVAIHCVVCHRMRRLLEGALPAVTLRCHWPSAGECVFRPPRVSRPCCIVLGVFVMVYMFHAGTCRVDCCWICSALCCLLLFNFALSFCRLTLFLIWGGCHMGNGQCFSRWCCPLLFRCPIL